jgi:hypothetical protein
MCLGGSSPLPRLDEPLSDKVDDAVPEVGAVARRNNTGHTRNTKPGGYAASYREMVTQLLHQRLPRGEGDDIVAQRADTGGGIHTVKRRNN